MTGPDDLGARLEEARERFLALVGSLRPALHRYCARMLGSAIDGEDMVQEVLAQAYFKLSLLKQEVPMRPWLFRIAHNRCVDALRLRRLETTPLDDGEEEDAAAGPDPVERGESVREALRTAVEDLPPRERSCLILKDVLDHTLEETAEALGSSVGAVKAALHRAREKLRAPGARAPSPRRGGENAALLRLYVERFNARDWDALAELLRADAQVEVVGNWMARGVKPVGEGYFGKYAQFDWWRLRLARVDGELVVLSERRPEESPPETPLTPWSVHRIEWREGRIAGIRDYLFATYLLQEALIEDVEPA
jgi:RNA polymerase sigma-70 factor (ECF subfamily)